MPFLVFMALQLAALAMPGPAMWAAAAILSPLWLWFTRKDWNRFRLLFAVALWALPPTIWLRQAAKPHDTPPPPDLTDLRQVVNPERYFGPASLDRVADLLRGRPRLGAPKTADLLAEVQLPDFASATVLNLNFEPLVWKGEYFSNVYGDLSPDQLELTMRDGRLFLASLRPLPSADNALGFLALECVVLTKHAHQRDDSWFGQAEPRFLDYRPLEAPPEYSDLLQRIAESVDAAAPPYDLHLIHEPKPARWLDMASLIWTLLFFLGALHGLKKATPQQGRWFLLAGLAMLMWPHGGALDFLTVFGSYVFGSTWAGQWLSTPFHLFLSAAFLFLLIQNLWRTRLRPQRWAAYALPAVLAAALPFAPDLLQKHNAFSFVHPLEALASPGACLSYLAFLSVFGYAVLLTEAARPIPFLHKLAALAPALVSTLIFIPAQWSAPISFGLIWLLKENAGMLALRAALATLLFYPHLVKSEQRKEADFVRTTLLDEITLAVERNYFRMGRIIQRLPWLQEQIEAAPHGQLMEMFARQAGLFEDEIDFAMRLESPDGKVVSAIEQHIPLDRIRYGLGPEDRIDILRESDTGPAYMVYRRTLPTTRGDFELAAALGADYQNLSPARRLRYLDDGDLPRWDASPTPYFAHVFDVFSRQGAPLYYQSGPQPLDADALRALDEAPYYWRVDDRNTVFYFKDDRFIYRITHKATPMRMVLSRFLALFLAVAALARVIQLAQRPGKNLAKRWRRSFAMKLAGFMFLSSVLPTSMLGFFLINSIQRNQAREEASIVQSKIQAATNLFQESAGEFDPRRPVTLTAPRDPDPAPAGSEPLPTNFRNLPLQRYARILGEDLSLYLSGSLAKTNQPEMFRQGYLNRRLPFALARELFLDKKAYTLERVPLAGGGSMVVAYAAIGPDPNRSAVLSMTMIPFSQRQNYRWLEQLEFSVTLLFGLLFIMALLTRFLAKNFLSPVSAITRGAARMAKGIDNRPIEIHRQDELERMIQAFNTMQERVRRGRRQLQRQFGVLDETLKAMSSGLLGFDRDGRIILENPKIWELLNLATPPRNLAALIRAEPELEPLESALAAGRSGEFSFHLKSEETERDLVAKFRSLEARAAHEIHGILAIEDITDAVAASRFKAWAEMARRVAHEIKNPLTPIQLEVDYLTNMFRDGHPRFGEALEEAAAQITRQVQDLRRIATEFGDYARPVTLDPAPADLAVMLRAVLDPYEKTLDKVDFESRLAPGLIARVDERLLRRACHNLVVNAIQAMDREGRLTVRLFSDAEGLHIWIQDSGPGIAPEERHRIFEAYFSTKDQGTGLGLVIAKKYIHLHGGALSVDPDYQDGTRFRIDLPLALLERGSVEPTRDEGKD